MVTALSNKGELSASLAGIRPVHVLVRRDGIHLVRGNLKIFDPDLLVLWRGRGEFRFGEIYKTKKILQKNNFVYLILHYTYININDLLNY